MVNKVKYGNWDNVSPVWEISEATMQVLGTNICLTVLRF